MSPGPHPLVALARWWHTPRHLRSVLRVAAGVLLVLGGTVMGVNLVAQWGVAELAVDARDRVLPTITARQETSRDIERLILLGEELLNSDNLVQRRQARLSAQMLVYNEPWFRSDPVVQELGERTLATLADLGQRRSQRDALNTTTHTLLLLLLAQPGLAAQPLAGGSTVGEMLVRVIAAATPADVDAVRTVLGPVVQRWPAARVATVERLFDLRREVLALDRQHTQVWQDTAAQLKSMTDTLATQSQLHTQERFAQIEARARQGAGVAVLGLMLTALLVGLLAWWVDKRVIGPLVVATEGLTQAHRGDQLPMLPSSPIIEVESIIAAAGALVRNSQALAQAEQASMQARVDALAESAAALQAAKDAAEAANIAKSRFLATMSHEIRTPLNGVLGMAQVLQSDELTPAQVQAYAHIIMRSGQSLLALLSDILDFSKIEAGRMNLEAGEVEPRVLMHDVHALYAPSAREKGLDFHVEWQGPPQAAYRGDPYRLHQMLGNLISNAIKFTHQGRVDLTGRVLAEQDGWADLEFTVTDTGIGVPADKQALLFKPFSQADNSTTRQFGGSGLGLSIVRHLARLMQGSAGMDSTPGQGSRFWFKVRLAPMAEAAPSAPPEATPAARPDESLLLHRRVLVVEDNAVNQTVLKTLLGRLGVQAEFADDGLAGLRCVQAHAEAFDAVLMDVQMPVMDGYEATRQIRAWEQAQGRLRLPIIAVTADAFAQDRERCLQAGMDDYLPKPVDAAALGATLIRWLALHAPSGADEAVLRQQAQDLLALLGQHQFAALDSFAALEARAAHTTWAQALASLRSDMQALRFDAVSQGLQRLLNEGSGASA